MYAQSRIPKLQDTTPDGALLWSELEFRGQLFHPEDDPANIVSIASSVVLITDVEVHEHRYLINPFDKNSGDDS